MMLHNKSISTHVFANRFVILLLGNMLGCITTLPILSDHVRYVLGNHGNVASFSLVQKLLKCHKFYIQVKVLKLFIIAYYLIYLTLVKFLKHIANKRRCKQKKGCLDGFVIWKEWMIKDLRKVYRSREPKKETKFEFE